DLESGAPLEPNVECCANAIAAVILFHRGDPNARRHLRDAERFAVRLGDRVFGPLLLARSLDREHAERPKEALAALLDGMPDSGDEDGQITALFADAVRLAVAVGDRSTARLMARRGEAVARGSDIPYRRAAGAPCRRLLDHDPSALATAAAAHPT